MMDFDFSFFLVAGTFITGVIWGGFVLYQRVATDGVQLKEPLVVEYARSFFPIILIVMVLRSFIVEPFRIPSGSMMPTLLIGDFILVNKFTYGLRLPVLYTKVVEVNRPERGDIVVFRFPDNPSVDYIKRVVGVPGDRIAYYNKQLYINGKRVDLSPVGPYVGVGQSRSMTGALQLVESLSGVRHGVLIRDGQPSVEGTFVVPDGEYFVMGDNRDNSNDSRYWGTVPEANLVGKAFFIWMSWDWESKSIGFDRIGTLLN